MKAEWAMICTDHNLTKLAGPPEQDINQQTAQCQTYVDGLLDPMIAGPGRWPVIRYATVRGLNRLAGTEPHA